MKLKLVLLVTIVLILSSCSRTLTPYEAANGRHSGKKCLKVR